MPAATKMLLEMVASTKTLNKIKITKRVFPTFSKNLKGLVRKTLLVFHPRPFHVSICFLGSRCPCLAFKNCQNHKQLDALQECLLIISKLYNGVCLIQILNTVELEDL